MITTRKPGDGTKISIPRRFSRSWSVDPDEELVRIQWLDREVEEIDLDLWNEMDLELADAPEGWVDDEEPGSDDGDEDDLDDELEDEDEDDGRRTTTKTKTTTTRTTSIVTASERYVRTAGGRPSR